MRGYLDSPAATAATIDPEGWLHTGDLGIADEDGWLTIVDRVKELIKYKGFQVAPAELEARLITHPQVADCAVIGVPDEQAGEVPKAFIVPAGSDFDGDTVLAFVAGQVAPYKRIRLIQCVQEIRSHPRGRSSGACSALLSASADRTRHPGASARKGSGPGPSWWRE